MSRYLMALSIGPVQGFIAAARRTRDFWMGSTMLQECAKAVALGVVDLPVTGPEPVQRLVFPAVSDRRELEPIRFDDENSELTSEFDVTNVVLCVVDESVGQLREIAGKLEGVAQARFRDIARKAAAVCGDELRDDWESQLNDATLEFFAAWVPLDDDGGYSAARPKVMRLLGGRKMCRDFLPWHGQPLVPKSSLDGARETVLKKRAGQDVRRRGLRVKRDEQLDIVGVAKRAEWGHDAIRYPSVSRVAVDPWVRGLRLAAQESPDLETTFKQIMAECEALKDLGALRRRKGSNPQDVENDLAKFPWLAAFPYEGTPLYVARHNEIRKEMLDESLANAGSQKAGTRLQEIDDHLGELKVRLESLGRPFQDPHAYVAFLAADGDRMGQTLSLLAKQSDGFEKHRQFSKCQSRFAVAVRGIVNQKFSGACFFAGADDVLAMVAVDQCLDCAARLHALFDEQVGQLVRGWGCPAPTLSVGIAIGHFLEPLENLLQYARAAEQRAKTPDAHETRRGQGERHGLAVAIHPRGGASFSVRDNWEHGLKARLDDWITLYVGRQLPTKAAYELRELARRYDFRWNDPQALQRALRADALRVLGRKRGGGDGVEAKRRSEESRRKIRRWIDPPAGNAQPPGTSTADDLRALAHELLVGQWIGAAKEQAAGSVRARSEIAV